MQGVMGYVMDSIDKGVENLPTPQETQELANKSRLIPHFSADATDPADVYPLHSLIPEAEWKAIPIGDLEAAQTLRERGQLLPHRKSDWINYHLKKLTQKEHKNNKNLKILFYISAMFAFRQALHFNIVEKEKLYERLASVPGIIVDNMLSRFSETPRNSSTYQATSSSKIVLLTHLFALCLKLDSYATDTKVLAHDLSMQVTEVNKLFRSLGCKIIKLGERERARLGLADSTADDKRAVLTAPVEFPKPKLKNNARK
jgi:DNA-directed RNA polymerase I subunit RPA49